MLLVYLAIILSLRDPGAWWNFCEFLGWGEGFGVRIGCLMEKSAQDLTAAQKNPQKPSKPHTAHSQRTETHHSLSTSRTGQDRTENPSFLSTSMSRPEPADPRLGEVGGAPSGCSWPRTVSRSSGIFPGEVSHGCGMRWSRRFLPTQTLLGFCGLQDQTKRV